jgi:hypothetical protein
MRKFIFRLTPDARAKARNRETVERAAIAAFEAAGRGEIHFARFEAGGVQYALSSRMVLEIDWLPNRVPDRVLRPASGRPPVKARRR